MDFNFEPRLLTLIKSQPLQVAGNQRPWRIPT